MSNAKPPPIPPYMQPPPAPQAPAPAPITVPMPHGGPTPLQAGMAVGHAAVKAKLGNDMNAAASFLGRLFLGNESLGEIVGARPHSFAKAGHPETCMCRGGGVIPNPNDYGMVPCPGQVSEAAALPEEKKASPKQKKSSPCETCGAKPDDGVDCRVITRRDGKTVPCPGCMVVR